MTYFCGYFIMVFKSLCHRVADFCPYVCGGRIGPQCVHQVTTDQFEMQARFCIKIAEIHATNTKV